MILVWESEVLAGRPLTLIWTRPEGLRSLDWRMRHKEVSLPLPLEDLLLVLGTTEAAT